MDDLDPFRPPAELPRSSDEPVKLSGHQPDWVMQSNPTFVRCGIGLIFASAFFIAGTVLAEQWLGISLGSGLRRGFGEAGSRVVELIAIVATLAGPIGLLLIVLGGIRRLRPRP